MEPPQLLPFVLEGLEPALPFALPDDPERPGLKHFRGHPLASNGTISLPSDYRVVLHRAGGARTPLGTAPTLMVEPGDLCLADPRALHAAFAALATATAVPSGPTNPRISEEEKKLEQ